MAGRIPALVSISLVVLLSLIFCSGAPTETATIFSDIIKNENDHTTESTATEVTELLEIIDFTDSSEEVSSSTDVAEAALVIDVAQVTTPEDLESVSIDLAPRLPTAIPKVAVLEPLILADDAKTNTNPVTVSTISDDPEATTDAVADSTDAVEIGVRIESIDFVESALNQPAAVTKIAVLQPALLVDVETNTHSATVIADEPEATTGAAANSEPTTDPEDTAEIGVRIDSVDRAESAHTEATQLDAVAPSTETPSTDRPEAAEQQHSGIRVVLKADHNRTEEHVTPTATEAAEVATHNSIATEDKAEDENHTETVMTIIILNDDVETVTAGEQNKDDGHPTESAPILALMDAPASIGEELRMKPILADIVEDVTEHALRTSDSPSDSPRDSTDAALSRDSTEPAVLSDSSTDSSNLEDSTESAVVINLKDSAVVSDSTDSVIVSDSTESVVVSDTTDSSVILSDDSTAPVAGTDDSVNEAVVAEPIPLPLVKIFDPSVDVEATTFLAEANLHTDPEATTESFHQVDGVEHRIEASDETLASTDESVMTTDDIEATEPGTESATESGTEAISETTALPAISKLQSRPSSSDGNAATLAVAGVNNKKRSYRGYKVYRVILPTEESVRRILSMEDEPGVEFWADPRLLLRPRGLFVTSAADVMVAPKIVPQIEAMFRQARLTYTVLIDDVHASIAKENPSGPSFARSQLSASGQHRLTWERYHRLADINSYVDYLKEAHPDWIEVVPIGKSSQGRPIQVIKLSRSRQPDGVETSQKKKKAILIDAGIHANEWITPAALTWMVNELVENADSYGCILDRFDWYFVPMVNPDGYEYSHAVDRMWRKTRRNYTSTLVRSSARKLRVDANDDEQCLGADINRNFEFHWRKGGSSSNVCSPAYAGVKPFSEPEARALANFMLKQRSKIAMYISLHSYSQMWLLPWGFAESRPEDFSELYSLAKIGARALQRVHNTSYLIGSVPDLLALASGTSQDWAKGVAGVRYSYTLEMRDAGERGMILPAQQIVPTAEETWAGIYASAVELAHRLYNHLPSCSPF